MRKGAEERTMGARFTSPYSHYSVFESLRTHKKCRGNLLAGMRDFRP